MLKHYKRPNGNLISHPAEVLQAFSKFYSDLLSPPTSPTDSALKSWLDDLPLPALSREQLEEMNASCSDSELVNIIKSLKPSKTPGPDGYSASYYKKFQGILIPHLKSLFNYILKGNLFPDDMLLANMSLIPKPNKDHSLPQNYRPISVINTDLKIFGRLLADRLSKIITTLIS